MNDYTTQKEYEIVKKLISEMNADGSVARFQGACLPASEILQAILHSRGVKSRLLECNALVTNSQDNGNSVHFIGFDSIVKLEPYQTDTHFVVLVEADKAFVVDMSIGHKMGNQHFVVVAPLSTSDPDIISEASFSASKVTYRVKKNLRYYSIHQKTISEKIELQQKIQKDIFNLNTIVKILILIGLINMAFNLSLLILKIT